MTATYFNNISLYNFEELSVFDCEQISVTLNSLLKEFNSHIADFKRRSVGNNTRTKLLNSTEDVELIIKALVTEKSLRTQSEYICYWIARLLLCQKTILSIGKFIEQQCHNYKIWWKKYISSDTSEVPDKRYLFKIVFEIYGAIKGACQNIGIALVDYEALYDNIDSSISLREIDFKTPSGEDAIDISKRMNQIHSEVQKILLENPSDSILGFSSLRTLLESYLILKIEDKIRVYIRIKVGTNQEDIQLPTDLNPKHTFHILKILFPQKLKEFDALRHKIYGMASETVHRGNPQPNYLVWGTMMFAMKELEIMINNLVDDDNKIGEAITFLKEIPKP